jgi:hypothetical protein
MRAFCATRQPSSIELRTSRFRHADFVRVGIDERGAEITDRRRPCPIACSTNEIRIWRGSTLKKTSGRPCSGLAWRL